MKINQFNLCRMIKLRLIKIVIQIKINFKIFSKIKLNIVMKEINLPYIIKIKHKN